MNTSPFLIFDRSYIFTVTLPSSTLSLTEPSLESHPVTRWVCNRSNSFKLYLSFRIANQLANYESYNHPAKPHPTRATPRTSRLALKQVPADQSTHAARPIRINQPARHGRRFGSGTCMAFNIIIMGELFKSYVPSYTFHNSGLGSCARL